MKIKKFFYKRDFHYLEVVFAGLTIFFSIIDLKIFAIFFAICTIAIGFLGIYIGRKPKDVYILPKKRFNAALCQSINYLIRTFCSTNNIQPPSGGTRIALFEVEFTTGLIRLIGRYSWGAEIFSIPHVLFKIGEGMIGKAVKDGEDVILENLPDVEIEPEQYLLLLMSSKLTKRRIKSLRTSSRAFYNFPIRTYEKGLEAVRFALCIDTDQPNLISLQYQEKLFQLIKAQLRIVGDLASIEG